ncbi:MAG: hypothetical protein WAU88_09260 [Candidatus Zixiibacteriota bacterium]
MNRLSFLVLITSLSIATLTPTASGQFNKPDSTGRMTSRVAMTFGSPSGLNIAFSHWARPGYGLRLTVGALPIFPFGYLDGGQAELLWRVHERGATILDISVGGGVVEAHGVDMADDNWLTGKTYESWSYAGLFATVNTHGFFLQTGAAFGSNRTRDVTLSVMLGFSLHSWHSHR